MRNVRLVCLGLLGLGLLGLCLWACAHVAPSGHGMKVMAFNVLFQGADDAKSIDAIAEEAPEVVCLTEVTPAFVKRFESSLEKDYPYRRFEARSGTWGVGFASKRPLRNVRTYAVAPARIPAMEATVNVEGRDVQLVCVHLMPPVAKHKKNDSLLTTMAKNAAVRVEQAETLVARFAKTKAPVVLLGDFNEEPGGEALKKLEKAGWVRGCEKANTGCSATFPGPAAPWPAVFAIDHVFARGLSFEAAKTVRAGGSDHYPVSAVVSLNRTAPAGAVRSRGTPAPASTAPASR